MASKNPYGSGSAFDIDPFNFPRSNFQRSDFSDQVAYSNDSRVSALMRTMGQKYGLAADRNVYEIEQERFEEAQKQAQHQANQSNLFSLGSSFLGTAGTIAAAFI